MTLDLLGCGLAITFQGLRNKLVLTVMHRFSVIVLLDESSILAFFPLNCKLFARDGPHIFHAINEINFPLGWVTGVVIRSPSARNVPLLQMAQKQFFILLRS